VTSGIRREINPGWIGAAIVLAILIVLGVYLMAGRSRPAHEGYKMPVGPKPAQPYIPKATN